MSFINRTTGTIRQTLPNHAGGVFGLAKAYAAGNVSLPVGGWYAATITTPDTLPHQTLQNGTWTYNDETGTATMTKVAVALPTTEAVQRIKAEAERRIQIIFGGGEYWRPHNMLMENAFIDDRIAQGTATAADLARKEQLRQGGLAIDQIRAKSNELELAYASEPFDFTADSVWAD